MNRVLISLSIAMLLGVAPGAVLASDGHHEDHEFSSGRQFGEHVSEHAQDGHLGKDMNPGVHHQGFSPWAPRK